MNRRSTQTRFGAGSSLESRTQGEEASATGNRLLAALPRRDYRRLAPCLKSVTLSHEEVLFEAGQPIRWVYFPAGGVVAILVPVEGDKVTEVAMVGREGMVGLPIFLGVDVHPHRAIVQ